MVMEESYVLGLLDCVGELKRMILDKIRIGDTEKALKIGGFLVSYSPSVPQVMDFVNIISKNKEFLILKTIEVIERKWEVDERKVRPVSQSIGHSGFLTFVRRV